MSGTVDETGGADVRAPSRAVPFFVVALEGERPLAASARFGLDDVACIEIGRGDARQARRRVDGERVTLDVKVPSPALSSRHARLLRTGNVWVLEDLGSTNGSFVNGRRASQVVLAEGDVLAMGRTIFLVTPPLATPAGSLLDRDAAPLLAPTGHGTLDPSFGAELESVARIATSELSVLILGETGTGKEVLARAMHVLSRRTGPFVAINCGAIPATLLESTLFGHVKGAFSGAHRDEPGLFRAAENGTLFLDEVGDLPLAAQVALLRALQEREVLPVGATRPIKLDVRVLAATHQEIGASGASGAFRRDLLARLSGFAIVLPPLRARPWDIGTLVASLLRKLAVTVGVDPADVRFTRDAGEALLRYGWPLNTRELEQCLTRALTLAAGAPVDLTHLPAELSASNAGGAAVAPELSCRDDEVRRALLAELAAHRGNLADVARAMGKARMQIHRWCKRFGIDPNLYRR